MAYLAARPLHTALKRLAVVRLTQHAREWAYSSLQNRRQSLILVKQTKSLLQGPSVHSLLARQLRSGQQAAQSSEGSTDLPPKKAAALIIGNEILSGSITDTNTPWLAKLLFNQGVDLVRAEYIPDDKQDIITTVLRLKERVGENGVIFSSGGIGPTHDDITYGSLASAFGASLEVDEGTVSLMREDYGKRGIELNESRLKMATLPKPSEVLRIPGLWVPLVNLQNVYILPGIPKLFCRMVEAHKERFQGPAASSRELLTDRGEGDLAEALTKVAETYPAVTIGSYPRTEQSQTYGVKLILQSRDQAALEAASKAVQEEIPTYN